MLNLIVLKFTFTIFFFKLHPSLHTHTYQGDPLIYDILT